MCSIIYLSSISWQRPVYKVMDLEVKYLKIFDLKVQSELFHMLAPPTVMFRALTVVPLTSARKF